MNNKTNKFNPSSLRDKRIIHCYQYVGRLVTWHMAHGSWQILYKPDKRKETKEKESSLLESARSQPPKVPTLIKSHKAKIQNQSFSFLLFYIFFLKYIFALELFIITFFFFKCLKLLIFS